MEKIGLVLEGGAAKGAYHIGAYEAIREMDINISGVAGTSIGSINGAFIVSDKIDRAREFWRNVDYKFFYGIDEESQKLIVEKPNSIETKYEVGKIALEKLSKGGIEVDMFLETIRQLLPEEDFRKSKMDYALITVNLSKMREETYYKDDIPKGELAEYLMASSYMIGLKPKKIDGNLYIDGGFADNLPFEALEKIGYKNMILVHCDGVGITKKPDRKKLNIIEIYPSQDTGSIWEFYYDHTEELLKLGYLDTLKVFKKLIGDYFFIEKENAESQISNILKEGSKRNNTPLDIYQKNIISALYNIKNQETQLNMSEMFLEIMEIIGKGYNIKRLKKYTINDLLKEILINSSQKEIWEEVLSKKERLIIKKIKENKELKEIFFIE